MREQEQMTQKAWLQSDLSSPRVVERTRHDTGGLVTE